MSSLSAAIRRVEHCFLIVALWAVWASAMESGFCRLAWIVPHDGSQMHKAAHEKVESDHPCAPVLVSKPKPNWPKAIRTRKGEAYKQDPVIYFGIAESGEVIKAKVVRSSGVRDIDAWVLKEIKRWKYRPAPSCGVRESETTVTIDFDME